MFKSEKIWLFLLISICLIICVVLIDTLMDPAVLIKTAYARFTGTEEPALNEIYIPEEDLEMIADLTEDVIEGVVDDLVPDELQDGWEWFRSLGYAFEIQYPREAVSKAIPNQDALNAGVGVNSNAPVWQFQLTDSTLYQGTNLVDASLLIHVLEGVGQESSCLAFKPGSIYQTPKQTLETLPQVELNGIPFVRDEVIEGAMGEFYQRIIYRTFAKGACYELTQLLQYQNPDIFIDGKMAEFDQEQVIGELDKVLETFRLLENEPTFPDQSYPEAKLFSAAIPKDISEYVDGIDVSHWQGDIDWPQVAGADIRFAFVKGTEGVGWTDVKFHTNMANGEDEGLYLGVYHFARPDLGNTGAEEANWFLQAAGDYLQSGYLRPVLDLEVGTSLGRTALSAWVVEWMETIKDRTGISPLLYTNLNYVNNYLNDSVTAYDLWIAYWSCEPEPTYTIPPTGRYRDWAFWQYYGPGGCGPNKGFVPGITTNIDLNIFNGVEAGLTEYDAASNLWVLLTSDAYYVPTPYFADLTGNVNGDATGLINFSFWWDCTALESDLSTVEASCGELPQPAAGTCEENEFGMRCVDVENDKQIAEHTYAEIGDYTAKVVVSRGGEGPVEDRYKVSTYNPIRTVVFTPTSTATGYIGELFSLQADVTIHTSLSGVLQVSVKNISDEEIEAISCIDVGFDSRTTEDIILEIADKGTGEVDYEVSTRYRAEGDCPIADTTPDDRTSIYRIDWIDEQPVMKLLDSSGEEILDDSTLDVGDIEPFTAQIIEFKVQNPSTVLAFEITSIEFENSVNVVNPQIIPSAPIEVGPEAEIPLELSYELSQSGAFSIDVVINHDASNPTPVRFTVTGNGVFTSNPIQAVSLDPVSPGSGFLDEDYNLLVEVDLAAPIPGALHVIVVDSSEQVILDSVCLVVDAAGQASHQFNLSWSESLTGTNDYEVWARYRDQGSCPVVDQNEMDISQGYQIEWVDDSAVMEMQDTSDQVLSSGETEDIGFQEAFSSISLGYTIQNTSSTNGFQVTSIAFENPSNVIDLTHGAVLPMSVDPGSSIPLEVNFKIESLGDFSFDVFIEHNASNSTPYEFSVSGTGVYSGSPITTIAPEPRSPGEILIGDAYDLSVAVDYAAPVQGALVVSVLDDGSAPVADIVCLAVTESGTGSESAAFSWSENEVANREYAIVAGFYAYENCPAAGSPIGELSISYQIDWQEDPAILEMTETGGDPIPSGSVVDLGQHQYYQTVDLGYLLGNTSTTSSLEITSVGIQNRSNIKKADTNPENGFLMAAASGEQLDISFEVENTGPFSFDLVIDHQGGDPNPYRVIFQGTSILTDNPIKFVVPTPVSPGASLIGEVFQLTVEVGLDAPDQGALQVSVVDRDNSQVVDTACATLNDNLDQTRSFNLGWSHGAPGEKEYTVSTRYRIRGGCPINDTNEGDLTQIYEINWREDIPELVIKNSAGMVLPHRAAIDLGEYDYYSDVDFAALVQNDSTTSDLRVSNVAVENLVNLDSVSIFPLAAIDLGPGEQTQVTAAFIISKLGDFSFDLVVSHDGSNENPYRVTLSGSSEMLENPIYSLTTSPASPGSSLTSEIFALQVQSEINPPAPGVIDVIVSKAGSGSEVGSTCLSVLAEHSILNLDLSWTEYLPGDVMYEIQIGYHADGSCPVDGEPDAVVVEKYQIAWGIHEPVLIVNRPEGVTIFDGEVDFVGEHEFFRFVEVTYVIANNQDSAPLVIDSIEAVNLENLREVIIEPEGVFEIAPGESQVVKVNFQILMLEPFSFDLVWEHSGSNPSPYTTGIEGTSKLNLGDGVPEQSWLYKFLESLIRSGFFLKIPPLWIGK